MASHEDRHKDGYGRARDPEEPGSHSGAESQAQPERGTTAGRPLEGIEAEEDAAPDGGDDEGSTGRG
ncbi:hypothetical protein [Streptomyces sp. enrichment culture]|uniref:hypothetical protein n=1 Tax=Streptomyces sp. enrichment culture TaxID=1795815 RepID=UPI003F57FAB0